MKASDIKGKVDFGIITILEDESKAVLKRFPHQDDAVGERTYSINHTETFDSDQYLVAVVRLPEQGEGSAHDAARDLITDLDPQWLILVGIGGAVPHEDFTLGDAVIATRVYDFCVEANFEDRAPQFNVAGGPMHREVEDLLARLPTMEDRLEEWNDEKSIGMQRPRVQMRRTDFYGSEEWQEEVKSALRRHFGRTAQPRSPLFTARPVASSDRLVKDSKTVQAWREVARHVCAIEMELAGVYRAARRRQREYPILAIRGISDIVGFKRHQDWTEYACHSAASLAYSLIRAKPISPRSAVECAHSPQEYIWSLEGITNLSRTPVPPKGKKRSRWEKFTPEARSALTIADHIARDYQNDTIDIEHMLLGILRVRNSRANRVIGLLGVDVRKIIEVITTLIPKGTASELEDISDRVKLAIHSAINEAWGRSNYIGSEHLLLGILSVKGPSSEVLNKYGVKIDNARNVIRNLPPRTGGLK